jgi:hypothetical protein
MKGSKISESLAPILDDMFMAKQDDLFPRYKQQKRGNAMNGVKN